MSDETTRLPDPGLLASSNLNPPIKAGESSCPVCSKRQTGQGLLHGIKITDVAQIIFSFLLVAGGLGQIIYLGQANEVSREAVKAAEQSAKVAEEAFMITSITETPSISPHLPLAISLQTKPFSVQVITTNEGSTAATGVIQKVEAASRGGGQAEPDYEAILSSLPAQAAPSVIVQHDQLFGNFEFPSVEEPATLDLLRTPGARLYIFGDAEFSDKFGGKHEVHFCSFYTFTINLIQNRQGLCQTWNETIDTYQSKKAVP